MLDVSKQVGGNREDSWPADLHNKKNGSSFKYYTGPIYLL